MLYLEKRQRAFPVVKGLRSDRCEVALKLATGTSVKLPASVLNESFCQGIVSLECEGNKVIPVHKGCTAANVCCCF